MSDLGVYWKWKWKWNTGLIWKCMKINGKEWKREDGIEIAEEIHTLSKNWNAYVFFFKQPVFLAAAFACGCGFFLAVAFAFDCILFRETPSSSLSPSSACALPFTLECWGLIWVASGRKHFKIFNIWKVRKCEWKWMETRRQSWIAEWWNTTRYRHTYDPLGLIDLSRVLIDVRSGCVLKMKMKMEMK